MKKALHIVLLMALLGASAAALGITRISKSSGNWSNASTWTPAGVPACGDSIVILATCTISITNQQDYSACTSPLKIIVYGKMMFYLGSKLSLPCGSYVIVYPGGVIDHDQGLASSNLINICGVVEWDSNTTLYGLACLPPTHPICANQLPVELLAFTAEACEESKICLHWQTLTETNNDRYEVECSDNATQFSTIGKVFSLAPAGNSLSLLNYSFTDNDPLSDVTYYRLRQVDKDGSYTLSRIVTASVNREKNLTFLVFPNYNAGEFTARISGLDNVREITVLLRDESGVVVYKALYFNPDLTNSLELQVVPEQQLPKGNYICSFIAKGEEHAVKVIVAQ